MSVQQWVAKNLLRISQAVLVAGALCSLAGAAVSSRASELVSWTYLIAQWTFAVMALAAVIGWFIRRVSGVALKTRASKELVAVIDTLPTSEKLQLVVRLGAGLAGFYAIGWIFGVLGVLLFLWSRHAA